MLRVYSFAFPPLGILNFIIFAQQIISKWNYFLFPDANFVTIPINWCCLLVIFRPRRTTGWNVSLWRCIDYTPTCVNGCSLPTRRWSSKFIYVRVAKIIADFIQLQIDNGLRLSYSFAHFKNRSSVVLGDLITNTDLDCLNNECSDPVQIFKPLQIVYHSLYSKPPQYKNDIGLIKLNRNAMITGEYWYFCQHSLHLSF